MLVTPSFAYKNIAGSSANTIKTSSGVLHAITINTLGAGVITVTDGTVAIATLKSSAPEGSYVYDVAFGTSLIVTTNAAASNVTVSYM